METRANKSLMFGIVAVVAIAIIVVVVLLLARQKNSNHTPALTAAQTNAAVQQIKTNWKTFYAASTSLQGREKVLQNGSSFTQPIQTEFKALGSQSSSAAVSSVNLLNSTSADVVYSVDLNGQPVLSDQKGQALLLNNTWKVSDSTLCQLLSLGGDKPSACQAFD